jgi:hypothetical protein
MTRRIASVLGAFVVTLFAAAGAQAQQGAGDVVYVPTPQVVVDAMLRIAKVGPGDTLIDLGSGDGRIVVNAARAYGARGLGVELDRHLLGLANESARREGVADRARFVEQDLFKTDLTGATVITTYLLPEMNLKLRPKLLALPPGTRIAAHDYHMGDWLPDETVTLDVPEKKVGNPGVSYVYLWRVPASVAGRWRSRITVRGAGLDCEFSLSQRFQTISGAVKLGAAAAAPVPIPIRRAQLSAETISFEFEVASVGAGRAPAQYEYRGRVNGKVMEGEVIVRERTGTSTQAWQATLVAPAPRDDQGSSD